METQEISQTTIKQDVTWESLEFISNAINDSQGTIRAIDIKLQIIFAFLVVPFSILDKIFACFDNLISNVSCNWGGYLTILLFVLFWASWIIGIMVTFLGIASIGNPLKHIKNDEGANGAFYLGDIFKFKIWHAIFRCGIKASQSIKAITQRIPANPTEQKKELTFELAKVAFIRDLKMYRQKIALLSVMIWLFSGALLLLIYRNGL